jgi:hypothetical protein
MESLMTTTVIPMLDGLQCQQAEMLMLAAVPASLSPSHTRSTIDLLHPLPVRTIPTLS